MKEEKEVLQKKEPAKIRPKMAFAILVLAALFVTELYLMINYPKNYLPLGIIGLAILCFVYLVTDLSFKLQDQNEFLGADDLERIYKAEKVSYVTMKKSFLEIERTLDRIRELSEIPTEELIQAQKAVGRVTIQRNKENAVAVIDSNDKLSRHLLEINERLDNIVQAGHDMGLADSQKETAVHISNLENAQNDIRDKITKLTAQSDAIMKKLSGLEAAAGNPAILEEPAVAAESEAFTDTEIPLASDLSDFKDNEPISESPAVTDEIPVSDAPDFADEVPMPEPPAVTDEIPVSDAPDFAEEMPVPEPPAVTDEIPAPDAPDFAEEMPVPESPAVTDEVPTSEISDSTESQASGILAAEEEPLELKQTMTPEEIATLLAGPDGTESASAPESNPPSSPDMSDPGHVMTPEEIAALLANI